MPIYIEQWRAVIGTFHARTKVFFNNKKFASKDTTSEKHFHLMFFIMLLIITHGYIELNPGLRRDLFQYLKICHWNVNSLLAHSFQKVSLIEAYNSLHKHDFICISESFLDSSITSDEIDLYIYFFLYKHLIQLTIREINNRFCNRTNNITRVLMHIFISKVGL